MLSNCVRPLPKNYQKTPYCLLNKKSKIHTRTCRSTMTQPQNFMEILSLLFNLKTYESQLCADNAERHQENAMISHFMMAMNCFLTSPSTEGTHTLMSPLSTFNSPAETLAIHKHDVYFFSCPCCSLDTKCLFPNSTFQIPLSFKLYLKMCFLYETFLNLFPLIFLFAPSP